MEVKPTDIEITAASKPEADCTDEDRKVRAVILQKCKVSFLYFLRFCKIVVPPTQENPGGVIAYQLWPHLLRAIKELLDKRLIEWLKSRQVGASWLIATYCLWYILFRRGAKVILISKGEVEAIELLAKAHSVYKYLPDFMQLKKVPDSLTEIGFPAMDSSIKVLPATKTAGVSFTCSILVFDEWQDHPFAEQNYFASKPTIDSGGGQFIGVYTQSAETLDTFANITYNEALDGLNGFTTLFTGYMDVPGRTREWYEKVKKETPREKLRGLTPEVYMQRNYPATIEEAMMPLQTIAAFDLSVLTSMMGDTQRRPIEVIRDRIDSNIVKIYKDFSIGQYFIAATDTAHGVGKDFSITVIMNVKTGEIVADIMNNVIPPEELALHSARLLDIFSNPLWFIEANDWGGVTISTAQNLNYKNLGYQDEREKRIGFLTTDKNRPQLWGDLIPAINNRQITIYNANGLKQFFDIVRNSEKGGRIEAMRGRNDDYPMAVGIAWLKKDEVNIGTLNLKPIETLHFSGSGRRIKHYRSRL